jgi:hypothetical protein
VCQSFQIEIFYNIDTMTDEQDNVTRQSDIELSGISIYALLIIKQNAKQNSRPSFIHYTLAIKFLVERFIGVLFFMLYLVHGTSGECI